MASPSPKLSKKKERSKKAINIIAVLLLLAAGLTVYLVYRNHQNSVKAEQALRADRAKFAEAEKSMAEVYSVMTSSLGSPVGEEKSAKQCAYTSQKFSKGDLYCTIHYGFAYRVASYDAALDQFGNLIRNTRDNYKIKADY